METDCIFQFPSSCTILHVKSITITDLHSQSKIRTTPQHDDLSLM